MRLRKKVRQPVDAGHQAMRDADPFAFQVLHARLAHLLRLSVAGNLVLLSALCVMTAAFLTILPVKEIRFALLRFEQSENQLVRVEPISTTVAGFELLLEQMARRYVRLVLEIDKPTQGKRLWEASRMTSESYYRRFKEERIESGALARAHKDGLVRSVRTENASVIDKRDNRFVVTVQFIQVDRIGDTIQTERALTAFVQMTTAPMSVPEEDRYENPLGIIVTDLAIKEREI